MLPQNLTFPNQISYAGFVGNYGRNFDLINYFICHEKEQKGQLKEVVSLQQCSEAEDEKCHFNDENQKQNEYDIQH